jgi:hypothetical protein
MHEAVCDAIACMSWALAPRKYNSTNAYLCPHTQVKPTSWGWLKAGCSAAEWPPRTWDCMLCSRAATSRPPWTARARRVWFVVNLAASGAGRWQWRASRRGSGLPPAGTSSRRDQRPTSVRAACPCENFAFCVRCPWATRLPHAGGASRRYIPPLRAPSAIRLSGLRDPTTAPQHYSERLARAGHARSVCAAHARIRVLRTPLGASPIRA